MPNSHQTRLWLLAASIVGALVMVVWVKFDPPSPPTPVAAGWLAQEPNREGPIDALNEVPDDISMVAASLELPVHAEAPTLSRESLDAFATLSLRIKNGRQPLRGVTVQAIEEGKPQNSGPRARTDRRGRARLNVPSDTKVMLELALPGVALPIQQAVQAPAQGKTKVVVIDASLHAEELSVRFQLVSYPSGAPLAGCRVTAKPEGASTRASAFKRTTDKQGFVTLPWIPEGSYIGEAPRHATQRVGAPESGTAEAIVLRLPADAMLFGQIALPTVGVKSTSQLAISVNPSGTNNPGTSRENIEELTPLVLAKVPLRKGKQWSSSGLGTGWVQVDRSGRWQIVRVRFNDTRPMTGFSLHARIEGSWRTLASGLEVHPGDRLEVLDPCGGAHDLTLQLHYDRGYSWGRAFAVRLEGRSKHGDQMRMEGYCDHTGVVRFQQVPLGTWNLHLVHRSESHGASRLATFEHTGAPKIDLTLTGWVPLRGQIEAAPGGAVHSVSLQRSASIERRMADGNGRFDLSPVRMDQVHVIRVNEISKNGDSVFGISSSEELFGIDGTIRLAMTDQLTPEADNEHFITGEDIVLKRPR